MTIAGARASRAVRGRAVIVHKVRRAGRHVTARLLALKFGVSARLRTRSLLDPTGACAVSLTTYGRRLETVHLTIESVGRGALLPHRLVLWVDAGDERRLSPQLRRLVRRGLEVRTTRAEWGPHKKYYPYCIEHADDGLLLVTADDDVFYHRGWLRDLAARAERSEHVVWCHRARAMAFSGSALLPYHSWPLVETSAPSPTHLATGVGGVAYTPEIQRILRDAGEEFMAVHARTDDIWLHLQEIRHGFAVAQVGARSVSDVEIPRSQRGGLLVANQSGGNNDAVLAATYAQTDVARLAAGHRIAAEDGPQRRQGARDDEG